MAKNKLELDWAVGHHTLWEREVCRAAAAKAAANAEMTLKERQHVSDETFRKSPSRALEVVPCEVCQESIADALLAGKTIFSINERVRDLLRSYGVAYNQRSGSLPRESRVEGAS